MKQILIAFVCCLLFIVSAAAQPAYIELLDRIAASRFRDSILLDKSPDSQIVVISNQIAFNELLENSSARSSAFLVMSAGWKQGRSGFILLKTCISAFNYTNDLQEEDALTIVTKSTSKTFPIKDYKFEKSSDKAIKRLCWSMDYESFSQLMKLKPVRYVIGSKQVVLSAQTTDFLQDFNTIIEN